MSFLDTIDPGFIYLYTLYGWIEGVNAINNCSTTRMKLQVRCKGILELGLASGVTI